LVFLAKTWLSTPCVINNWIVERTQFSCKLFFRKCLFISTDNCRLSRRGYFAERRAPNAKSYVKCQSRLLAVDFYLLEGSKYDEQKKCCSFQNIKANRKPPPKNTLPRYFCHINWWGLWYAKTNLAIFQVADMIKLEANINPPTPPKNPWGKTGPQENLLLKQM